MEDILSNYHVASMHVGIHQKVVILVTLIAFKLIAASAFLIWIGTGKIPIDRLLMARRMGRVIGNFNYFQAYLSGNWVWIVMGNVIGDPGDGTLLWLMVEIVAHFAGKFNY
ncbi:hypothetical protein M9H77_11172 [Catharanthus roseus]|uniref:Uncharacterized protein n=1 Tax=Catharanthus roseus TaxID=4058 RepID=A0ACC0BE17_CATRO|nr:hypothetical protein M9H77_11172 [Catharanthus roseus]